MSRNILPEGWRTDCLGDVSSIVTGGTPNRNTPEYWGGAIPWMSSGEINHRIVRRVEEHITELGMANSNARMLPPDTVMMALNGQGKTRGKVALLGIETTCNQSLAGIIANTDRLLPHFLFYYLDSQYQAIRHITGDDARNGLNLGILRSLTIPVPPLDEQRRIVEVLRSVDEAISANEDAAQQRDKIRRGLNSLFLRGIGHSEFQWSDLGEIPASWQVRTMSEVCSNVGVGIASSATHAYVASGVPMLRNQNIRNGHIDLTDLLFVTEDYDFSYRTKRVRAGDVITMRTGYPGRSAVIPKELDGSQTFTTLISRPRQDIIDPHFLCEWINSVPGTVEVRKRQAGGAQQNLNAGSLKQLPVPLPPLEEQRKIAAIFRHFPTEDDTLIANLRSTRTLLQSDLLTGQVRLPA